MEESSNLAPKSIPKELHSEYEERPFRNCTRCGETLVDYDEGYHVAKIFKSSETIFEYALCFSCHSGLINEFSEDSKSALEEYYAEHMRAKLGLSGCGLCGLSKSEFLNIEYSIGALCHGEVMLEGFVICAPCMDSTNSLISDKTQRIWDDFLSENFPGVPANALPAPGKLGVI